jgi:hypothetical protein
MHYVIIFRPTIHSTQYRCCILSLAFEGWVKWCRICRLCKHGRIHNAELQAPERLREQLFLLYRTGRSLAMRSELISKDKSLNRNPCLLQTMVDGGCDFCRAGSVAVEADGLR